MNRFHWKLRKKFQFDFFFCYSFGRKFCFFFLCVCVCVLWCNFFSRHQFYYCHTDSCCIVMFLYCHPVKEFCFVILVVTLCWDRLIWKLYLTACSLSKEERLELLIKTVHIKSLSMLVFNQSMIIFVFFSAAPDRLFKQQPWVQSVFLW